MPRAIAWTVTVLAALAFRLAVVGSWHVPGGDGVQYYHLSQTLREHGRYSFGLKDEPSYSRLPGYPIFLAYVASRTAPAPLDQHVVPATRANAVIDVVTACLVAFALTRLGALLPRLLGGSFWLPWLGFLGVVIAPGLILLSGYAMTETLATCLATLEVTIALLALDGELVAAAIGAGLVAGLGQLVRADAATFAPAVLICLWAAPRPRPARLRAIGLFLLVAGITFAPWPLRNLKRFGKPYPFAAYWRTRDDGRPLPGGVIAWARTWGTGQVGESFLDLQFAVENPIDDTVLLPQMWDDEAEHERVWAIFQRYNQERLSPAVDAELAALARERRARAPFRTFVSLPLQRLRRMWSPIPFYELPMTVRWLSLGRSRIYFWGWRLVVGALGLVGVGWLLRRGQRALGLSLGAPIVVRSLLLASTIAIGATERHIVELMPILVMLAVLGVAVLVRPLRERGPSSPS